MTTENKLHFPKQLRIKLIDQKTQLPVSRVAVTLIIYAQRQNSYYLGLPLSNSYGVITVEENWVAMAINHLRDNFIMDYSSTLEECSPNICIDVMSTEQIIRAINAMKVYKIENGSPDVARTILDLRNASNKNYQHQEIITSLNIPDNDLKEIIINLSQST